MEIRIGANIFPGYNSMAENGFKCCIWEFGFCAFKEPVVWNIDVFLQFPLVFPSNNCSSCTFLINWSNNLHRHSRWEWWDRSWIALVSPRCPSNTFRHGAGRVTLLLPSQLQIPVSMFLNLHPNLPKQRERNEIFSAPRRLWRRSGANPCYSGN